MFNLTFPKSRSKNFPAALKLAQKFETVAMEANEVKVEILVKEIFEKWDSFNLMFWTVIDWSGCHIEHNGMKYYSHNDKSRLFYSMQQAHCRWMVEVGHLFESTDQVYTGKITLEELEKKFMIEEEVNKLLDLLFPNPNKES